MMFRFKEQLRLIVPSFIPTMYDQIPSGLTIISTHIEIIRNCYPCESSAGFDLGTDRSLADVFPNWMQKYGNTVQFMALGELRVCSFTLIAHGYLLISLE